MNGLTKAAVAGAVLAACATGLTACGSGRSTEAFCDTLNEHKDRYLSSMEAAGGAMEDGDALAGLLGAASAIGDIAQMWSELAEVAPQEIQTDVEAIRDQWQKQDELAGDTVSDPLAGLASGLAGAFQIAGPMQRVDQFAIDNCDGTTS